MSKQNLTMPKLGLTMTEGSVTEWLVKPGQRFGAGEILVVIETEKVANEVPAPENGELVAILVPEGETVPVGTALATWSPDRGSGAKAGIESLAQENSAPSTANVAAGVVMRPPQVAAALPRIAPTPLARRIARQHGIDLATVKGSGPHGRIKAVDVGTAVPTERAVPSSSAVPARHQVLAPSSLQRTTARRLAAAKRDIPHFYLTTEVDVIELEATRRKLSSASGLKLTVSHFLLAAVARSLRDQPDANRVWHEDQFLQLESIDVGIAVSTPAGLLAPVIRDIGSAGLRAIATQAQEAIGRARQGAMRADDMGGGAITVSNAGMFDVTYMSSIINPGQSAILGVGSIRELFRPDADRRPKLCREIGLVLSCDHRVLDGASGAKLLNGIKHYLEQPLALLIT